MLIVVAALVELGYGDATVISLDVIVEIAGLAFLAMMHIVTINLIVIRMETATNLTKKLVLDFGLALG